VFLDNKARLAFAGRYDIFTGLGCDCVTRGGDRRLTEMLGWSHSGHWPMRFLQVGKIIDFFFFFFWEQFML
jgi:hypothetical protein